jgi:hypothetical protein
MERNPPIISVRIADDSAEIRDCYLRNRGRERCRISVTRFEASPPLMAQRFSGSYWDMQWPLFYGGSEHHDTSIFPAKSLHAPNRIWNCEFSALATEGSARLHYNILNPMGPPMRNIEACSYYCPSSSTWPVSASWAEVKSASKGYGLEQWFSMGVLRDSLGVPRNFRDVVILKK